MKLGEKIKQLRNNAGLTQPELAQKATIEQSYLSKLENDKGSPSFEVISNIAQAFDMDAMALIESLSPNYLQEQLAHLPEVAIKIEARKQQYITRFKRGYAIAATLIVLGIACVMLGKSDAIFTNALYEYESSGVIKADEPIRQFSVHRLSILSEDRKAHEQRIQNNIPRLQEIIRLSTEYRGQAYIEEVDGGRRYYQLTKQKEIRSPWQEFNFILGMVMITMGGFGLGYVFKTK